MAETDLRTFYLAYVKAANDRNFTAIRSMVADEVLMNDQPVKGDDIIASLRGFVDAVPNFSWHLEDLIVSDDRIAARLLDTGVPEKAWLGLEPTGRQVKYTEFAHYKVKDGKFVEMWFLMDFASAAQQIAGN